jgi:serine/threonine protein kinase
MIIPKINVDSIKILSGHSGCVVELCLVGDSYFVRKTSASYEYNRRLRNQINKQIALSGTISTPVIYDEGEKDGLLFFDMEFVRGHGFVSYAPLQSLNGICAMVERLTRSIQLLANTASGCLEPQLFLAKLEHLSEQLPLSPFYHEHAAFLTRLMAVLLDSDWSAVPRSLCHGDLTVENMLIKEDDSIVFIDFLDGDLESVWMDIAKLIQDLESGWSLRSLLWAGETAASSRLLQTLTRYLAEEIDMQMTAALPSLRNRLAPLRAIQALRVLPYVTNPETFSHVVRGLNGIEFHKEPT